MECETVEMSAANVGKLRKLVADMRARVDPRYSPDQWMKLCNDIEACLPKKVEAEKPGAGEKKPAAFEDTLRGLGGMIGAGLGLAFANNRGEPQNVTVYVTCNGK